MSERRRFTDPNISAKDLKTSIVLGTMSSVGGIGGALREQIVNHNIKNSVLLGIVGLMALALTPYNIIRLRKCHQRERQRPPTPLNTVTKSLKNT